MLEPLPDAGAVLAATGYDPYARSSIRHARPRVEGWRRGAAVGWFGTDEVVTYFSVMGPRHEAAALLSDVAEALPRLPRVTLPRGTTELLPSRLHLNPVGWDFRWTDAAPPTQALEREVCWLEPDAEDEIAPLLASASPTASVKPRAPQVHRWAGLRATFGSLDACAADTSGAPGVGHISSVAVRPEARRRGVGAAVAAWTARRLLLRYELVTLAHYSTNLAGQALYDRLGFRKEHYFESGVLEMLPRQREASRDARLGAVARSRGLTAACLPGHHPI